MPVRRAITEPEGVYCITITCARWMPLLRITNGYGIVYNWFNYLKGEGHYIIGYVIMPDHLHAVIAFSNKGKSINMVIGNGKRFMAYEIVQRLQATNSHTVLTDMQKMVNATDSKRNKKHEVFEPSFDWKVCSGEKFLAQKLDYIHYNPCRATPKLAAQPEDYAHSSAGFYLTGKPGLYAVTSFMELMDIDLTKKLRMPQSAWLSHMGSGGHSAGK
jgi:REP element-mobilizing transposase RayT